MAGPATPGVRHQKGAADPRDVKQKARREAVFTDEEHIDVAVTDRQGQPVTGLSGDVVALRPAGNRAAARGTIVGVDLVNRDYRLERFILSNLTIDGVPGVFVSGGVFAPIGEDWNALTGTGDNCGGAILG